MTWEQLTNYLKFTGVDDKTVWQDTIISSILIGSLILPLMLSIFKKVNDYIDSKKPLNLLFDKFTEPIQQILVFLSQLNAINQNGQLNPAQQYIIQFPNPLPGASSAISIATRVRIDPVWSQGDGECLSDVFNILGTAGKVTEIKIGDTINDWYNYDSPIISIGFSPKTIDLESKVHPISYKKFSKPVKHKSGTVIGSCISLKNSRKYVNDILPNDGGIIQKAFLNNTKTPVFIMAGLGTLGTSAAGYLLNKHAVDLGKLYANNAFCVLFSVNTTSSRKNSQIVSMTPRPKWLNITLHAPTYLKYKKYFI